LEDGGTLKVAVKNPAGLLVTVLGLVATGVPSNSIVIVEEGAKLVPVTSTEVPTGPEVGLIEMPGLSFIGPTVNCFEITLAEIL
jgi:hypothetical protein